MRSFGTSRPERRVGRRVRTTTLVASCLLSALLVACGDDDAPSVASASPDVESAATTVPAGGVVDAPPAASAVVTAEAAPATTDQFTTSTDASRPTAPSVPDSATAPDSASGPCEVGYEVVSTRPHDPTAFTQGLVVDGDVFHESTGLYGESTVRTVDPDTGQVLRSTPLPAEHFGEGLTLFDDLLYQLTWREGVVHVYDRSLTRLETRSWPGEGWGLTTDGTELILSDGTPTLFWIDPTSWTAGRTVTVTDDGQPLSLLNELEFVDGAVLANVWMTPIVAIVDPNSGDVTGRLDLTALLPDPATLVDPADDVLNGVALDPATGHLFVTGKRWSTMFELDVDRSCWPDAGGTTP
jgi:glutamine cyclotransferase